MVLFKDKFFKQNIGILLLIGIVLALLFNVLPTFPALFLKNIESAKTTEMLNSIFFATLIVERSLEVFVTIWQSRDEIELESKIAEHKKTGELDKQQAAEKELIKYKDRTRELSLYIGFTMGLIVSLVGFRILDPLVDLETVKISIDQKRAFFTLDIILTGLTLAGGSNAFHILISVFTDFLIEQRRRINSQV